MWEPGGTPCMEGVACIMYEELCLCGGQVVPPAWKASPVFCMSSFPLVI